MHQQVETACKRFRPVMDVSETEKGHGRIETHRFQMFEKGMIVDSENSWAGLQSVVKIISTIKIRDKITIEECFYISSLDIGLPFNTYIREHWRVENNLHWTLDMVFREDEQRKRIKHAAENFSIIKKIALNLLKKDSGKESLRSK